MCWAHEAFMSTSAKQVDQHAIVILFKALRQSDSRCKNTKKLVTYFAPDRFVKTYKVYCYNSPVCRGEMTRLTEREVER